MSNWDGVGTPENGQWLSAGDRARVQFIGVNSFGDWIIEDEDRNPKIYDSDFCRQIKTPKQVEREKGVDMSDLIKTDNSKVIAQLESRIAELEKELATKTPPPDLIWFTRSEVLGLDREQSGFIDLGKFALEQQAKGIKDALNYIPVGSYLASSASVQEYLNTLKAKALKEQG